MRTIIIFLPAVRLLTYANVLLFFAHTHSPVYNIYVYIYSNRQSETNALTIIPITSAGLSAFRRFKGNTQAKSPSLVVIVIIIIIIIIMAVVVGIDGELAAMGGQRNRQSGRRR
jgi:hypothetical protein